MILRLRLWILNKLVKKAELYKDVMKPAERNFVESTKKFVEKGQKK